MIETVHLMIPAADGVLTLEVSKKAKIQVKAAARKKLKPKGQLLGPSDQGNFLVTDVLHLTNGLDHEHDVSTMTDSPASVPMDFMCPLDQNCIDGYCISWFWKWH